MTWSLAGLGLLVAGQAIYLLTLALKRTLATRLFDGATLIGAAAACGAWAVERGPVWPAGAALAMTLVWFAATRKELGLPRAALKLAPGDRLPAFALTATDGSTVTDAQLIARGPAMIVLYRGWWCPYCVTQLNGIQQDHARLAAAGLTLWAISVDRPDEQRALEARLGGVRFLSDQPGALIDALGVRHPDGVPWYDRLLLGARRQDIALPATLLVDAAGVVRFARRARRIDDRPPVEGLLAAWRAAS
jgi:peroxiredoxin